MKKEYSKDINNEMGFSLVELSIVLVIIGLIVGAVLVGQDLIKNAEIRKTVSQIESYSSAINTFRGKFNHLPGDILSSKAAAFGFTGGGNGNGVFEGASGTGNGERSYFWSHLSSQSLIEGGIFDGAQTAGSLILNTTYPSANIGIGGFGIYTNAGINYFHLGIVNSADTNYTTANSLTPVQAYGIDNKIDDGFPTTGVVRASTGFDNPTDQSIMFATGDMTTAAGGNSCVVQIAGTTPEFNASSTVNLCQLRIRLNN